MTSPPYAMTSPAIPWTFGSCFSSHIYVGSEMKRIMILEENEEGV
jgi:hypothetical protein